MELPNTIDIDVPSESLLFRVARGAELADAATVFSDLNLDRLVRLLNVEREDYGLESIVRTPLRTVDDVLYRQEVFRDLEHPPLLAEVCRFCEAIANVRRDQADNQKLYYAGEMQAAFLRTVAGYSAAVQSFTAALSDLGIRSRGLRRFRDFLQIYTESRRFRDLGRRTRQLQKELSELRYCLLITSDGFVIEPLVLRPNYAEQLEKDLEPFEPRAAAAAPAEPSDDRYWSHIDEKLLAFVSELYPDLFGRLAAFVASSGDFFELAISRFEREMQFYIAYLRCVTAIKEDGLPFCYPTLSKDRMAFEARDAFDIALALELKGRRGARVTCNFFCLEPGERLTVITGANQGGKTTFARMVGQLHYLAALGCPVPARSASLFLCDGFFTHFERPELADSSMGKLEDDLYRLRTILDRASSDSLIILNEIFTSTTFRDASVLSLALIDKLVRLEAFVVWVTFVDALACYGKPVVSLVADGSDAAPFTLSRKPPSGLTHALALAEKHGLTYQQLKERLRA